MLHAAQRNDAGKPCGAYANAANAGFTACERAIRPHAGVGRAIEYYVEPYFCSMLAMQLALVSREMSLCFIAELDLRLPQYHQIYSAIATDVPSLEWKNFPEVQQAGATACI